MQLDANRFLKKLSKHTVYFGGRIKADRLFLIEELVEAGVYKSKTEFLEKAIDELLKQHFPDYFARTLSLEEVVGCDA